MVVTKTLSIPEDQQKFLDDNPDLSPSKMLQSKILEIKENRRMLDAEGKFLKAIETYKDALHRATTLIDNLERAKSFEIVKKHLEEYNDAM